MIEETPRVPAAAGVEQVDPDDERRSLKPRYLGRRRPGLGNGAVEQPIEGEAGDVHVEAGGVQQAGAHQRHRGAGGGDLGMRIEMRHLWRQPAGRRDRVGVEDGEVAGGDRGENGAHRARIPEVLPVVDRLDPRIRLEVAEYLGGSVGRCIVDDDDPCGGGICGEGLDAPRQRVAVVEPDHDHRHAEGPDGQGAGAAPGSLRNTVRNIDAETS